jgi:DNA primase catalytic core
MRYQESELQELKDKNPILEVIREKGLEVVKRGRNYATICPFHPDKNPSLIITPENNLWNCLGCPSHNGGTKSGGNVFDFIMKHENISFIGAVEQLKKRNGTGVHVLSAKEKKQVAASAEGGFASGEKKEKVSGINKQKLLANVIEFYHKTFSESPTARGYLRSRGITDPAIMETFKIGYANGTLHKTIPETGEIVDVLKEIGIVTETKRELFKDCVIFPIYDFHGNIVNIYGRKIVDETSVASESRKAMEVSPVRHLYMPGPHRGVFNYHILKSYDEIILTESIIDSLSLYQAGIKNTIPCYGINGLTDDHLRAFKENNTREIIILFDGDLAGKEAGQAVRERLSSSFSAKQMADPSFGGSCRIAVLPDGEDPNSFLLKNTPEDIEKIIYGNNRAYNKSETPIKPRRTSDGFNVQICNREYNVHGIEGTPNRLKAAVKACSMNRFHIDTVELYQSKSRKLFVRETALLFKEDPEIIESDLERLITMTEEYLKDNGPSTPAVSAKLTEAEKREALSFAKSADLIGIIKKDISKCGYVGEDTNKLLCYMAMTSRKMDDPLSVLIISGSGAGKTSLQDTILGLCPEADVVKLTSLTGRALFYKEEYSLSHKVLAIEEDEGAEDASYAIRNLISAKQLTIEATIKDQATGRMTTMSNTVKGPTSVFKTTTDPMPDPETKSRFIVLSVDESREQTQRILEYQRYLDTRDGYLEKQEKIAIIEKHRVFQAILENTAVFNPYAQVLTYPNDRLLARRDHKKYISIIKAVTFLNQFQRKSQMLSDGTKYIETTLEDIQTANELAHEVLGRNLDELADPSRTLLGLLEEMTNEIMISTGRNRSDVSMTRREIREYTKWSDYQVRTYLRQLIELEYVTAISGRNGQQYRYCVVYMGGGTDKNRYLPGLKSIEEIKREAQAHNLAVPCDSLRQLAATLRSA